MCEQNADNAFWTPVSRFTRRDGSQGVFPHTVTDRGKPGVIAVNRSGRRFTNEAQSYHEFVRAMFRGDNDGPCIPAYLICDRRFLWRYGLGGRKTVRAVAARISARRLSRPGTNDRRARPRARHRCGTARGDTGAVQ